MLAETTTSELFEGSVDATRKQSSLQKIITEPTTAHYKWKPAECELARDMLSLQHSSRRSCAYIIERIQAVAENTAYAKSDSITDRDEQGPFIPSTVKFFG